MEKISLLEKKQLKIFLPVAFALPYLMGILMGYAYKKGTDVSCFPLVQMYYPSAGIMLATLFLKKEDKLVPRKFYLSFIALTVVLIVVTVVSALIPGEQIAGIFNLIIMTGTAVSWLFLLTETKEKREAYGLNAHCAKASVVMVILFIVLYFGRIFLSVLILGQLGEFAELFGTRLLFLPMLSFNFFLTFTAFFGEEYGWRYYFTPFLQKHFGKVKGVVILGVLWGIWHLPINLFYYSPQTWLQSIIVQQIVCIALGIFFTYAYIKTNNIWVPVILHFLNNNLIAVLSADVNTISNQVIGWGDVLGSLVVNLIVFVPFVFSKVYKHSEKTKVAAAK